MSRAAPGFNNAYENPVYGGVANDGGHQHVQLVDTNARFDGAVQIPQQPYNPQQQTAGYTEYPAGGYGNGNYDSSPYAVPPPAAADPYANGGGAAAGAGYTSYSIDAPPVPRKRGWGMNRRADSKNNFAKQVNKKEKAYFRAMIAGWLCVVLLFALTIAYGYKSDLLTTRSKEYKRNLATLGYGTGLRKSVQLSTTGGDFLHGYDMTGSVYDGTGYWAIDRQGLPEPRSYAAAVSLGNSYALICGGRDAAGNPKSTCWLYDFILDKYDDAPPLPAALAEGKLAFDGNRGRAYFISGATGNNTVNDRLFALGFNNTLGTFNSTSWDDFGQVPGITSSPCVATFADRLYLLGGFDANGRAVPTVRFYSLSQNGRGIWAGGPLMLYPRGACAAVALPIQLVVTGGRTTKALDTETTMADVESLDALGTKWSHRTSLHRARSGHSAGVVNGSSLLVFGGTDGADLLTSVESYSPAADTWIQRAPLGSSLIGVAGTDVSGTLFGFGGSSGCETGLPGLSCNGSTAMTVVHKYYGVDIPDVYMYVRRGQSNLEALELRDALLSRSALPPGGFEYMGYLFAGSGYWYPKAPLPVPKRNAAVVAVGSKIFVIGGVTTGAAVTSTVDIYDTISDTWTAGPPLPGPRCRASAVQYNGIIYLLGGTTSAASTYMPDASAFKAVQTLDTSKIGKGAAWVQATKSALYPRVDACAAVIGTRLFILGGMASSGAAQAGGEVADLATGGDFKSDFRALTAGGVGTFATGCAALGGKIYMAGGLSRGGATRVVSDRVVRYDPSKDPLSTGGKAPTSTVGIYTELAALPSARAYQSLVATDGDSLLAAGGEVPYGTGTIITSELLEFFPAGNVWAQKQPSIGPVSRGVGAFVRGAMFMLGGAGGATGTAPPAVASSYVYQDAPHPQVFVHRLTYQTTESLFETKLELSATPTPSDFRYTALASISRGSGQWGAEPDMPVRLSDFTPVIVGDDVFIFGGLNGDGNVNNKTFVYDTLTRTYTVTTDWDTPRTRFGAAAIGSRIYVMGGYEDKDGSVQASGTAVFDTVTRQWDALGVMPSTFSSDGCAAAIDGRIYYAGGYDATFTPLDILQTYDVTVGWGSAVKMPGGGRGDVACAASGRNFVVLGGWAKDNTSDYAYKPLRRVEYFNLDSGSWTTRENALKTPRGDAAAVTLPSGNVLIMGGENPRRTTDADYGANNQRPVPFAEEYAMGADFSIPRAPLATPRFRYGAVTAGDAVLAFGGNSVCTTTYGDSGVTYNDCPANALATVERYLDTDHPSVWIVSSSTAKDPKSTFF